MRQRTQADEPARRAMRAVLAWEEEHGRQTPDWTGRCKRILEAVAGNAALRQTDVRGLRALLRNRHIPAERVGLVESVLALAGEMDADVAPDVAEPGTWSPDEVRAWTERHGGNVSRLAREMGVSRQTLQGWMADPATTASARPVLPIAQRLMEAWDRIAELEGAG